ncbi:replication protein [Achromobacter sp. AONIH1]|uniref:replication protein n=1 Tax=Achromobacter sp. AONIH1 TaxID=1758194 RepID=UPI000CD08811|nr:replication protein [Achromobacter sp. AONIH1]AUT46989.1 hypothetical protein C2U31_13910 [Achromobacter sp. AONIH1]
MSAVILTMPIAVPAASPQVEDGYTRISNELLGALVLADLSKQQWEVMMAVIRKTYGFNKTEDDIALSQLAAMTDGDRGNLSRAVAGLVSRRMLNRSRGRHGQMLSINKDYTLWGMKPGRVELVVAHWKGGAAAAVVELTTEDEEEGCNSYNSGVVEATTGVLSDLQPQKTTPKENIKRQKDKPHCAPQADRGELGNDGARADQEGRAETAPQGTRAGRKGRAMTVLTAEQLERFERFYQAYPRKRSRQAAEKAFGKINPDDALVETFLEAIEKAKTTEQWSNPQMIPHPSSWLNDGAWADEIVTAYSEREREVIDSFNETLGDAMGLVDPAIYSERRAGAIRKFLTLSAKPSFWTRFFPWILDNCNLPAHAGFEWLMKPETVSSLRGGQFTKEQGR